MTVYVVEVSASFSDRKPLFPYRLMEGMRELDQYRHRGAAEYAARLINNDLAAFNPHRLIGCRVEAR